MPDLDWNFTYWAVEFNWASRGEQWSAAWGGSEAQWFGSLYPRLHRFLPSNAIHEIAPGYGRWTRFLLPACRRFVGIDLSPGCVAGCRQAFAAVRHATFHQNDGFSLDKAPDGEFDLVFSFDSLVHVERDVLECYIPQILRKLSSTGVAFIHNSNLGALNEFRGMPGARGASVSADIVHKLVSDSGGRILVQEVINWGRNPLLDCLTLFGGGRAFQDISSTS